MQPQPLPRTSLIGRSFALTLLVSAIVAPKLVHAQGVTVSGVVVETAQFAPVGGALIRLSDLPPTTTDRDGQFRFTRVLPGRYTLEVEAFGYRPRSLEIVIRADTAVHVQIDPDPVVLDSLLVSAGNVTIKGTVRDAVTGMKLLQGAQVTIYPGARTIGALSGSFTLRNVPSGRPIGLLIEALEYLPARVEFVADRDTTLDVPLKVDSVAIRLVAQQVKRLETRSHAIPHSINTLSRADINRAVVPSIGELLRRQLPRDEIRERDFFLDNRGCVFLDDMPVKLADVYTAPPAMIERVEIYGYRGDMIRVYTRRYVATLMRVPSLPPIMFMRAGLGTAC